jgi:hypothetical protein
MSKSKAWAARLRDLVGRGGGATADPLTEKKEALDAALADAKRQTASFSAFPHADVKPLTALLTRVEQGVAANRAAMDTYDAALAALRGFEPLLKTQQKAQKQASKDHEKAFAALPDAKIDLTLAERMLAGVERDCAGIDDTVAKIRDVVEKARKAFLASDGLKCIEELQALKKLPDREACLKLSDKARARVQSADLPRAEKAVLALNALLSPARMQPYADQFRALRGRLMASISDPQVIGELRQFADHAEAELARHRGLQASAKGTLERIAKTHQIAAAAVVSDAVQVALNARLQAAQGAFAVKDFESADALALEAEAAFNAALARANPLAEQWRRRQAEWAPAVAKLTAFKDPKKNSPDVVARAVELTGGAFAKDRWIADREWLRLIETLDTMQQGAQTIDAVAALTKAFAPQVKALAQPVADAFTALRANLANVEQAMKSMGVDPQAGAAGLRSRLDAMAKTLDARCTSAVDRASLDVAGMLKQVAALSADVDAAGSKKAIEATGRKLAGEQALATFDKLHGELAKRLDDLEGSSRAAAATLRTRLDGLKAASVADPVRAEADAQVLKTDLAAAEKKVLQDVGNARETLKRECDAVGRLIDETWEKLRKTAEKKFKPVFDALRVDLDTARVIADSRSAEAGGAALQRLTALRTRLQAMAPPQGQSASPFAAVMIEKEAFDNRLDEAKSRLEKDASKAWLALQADTKALHDEMFSLAPDAAMKRFKALAEQLAQAEADALIVGAYRESVAQLRVVVKAKLELLEEDATAPVYKKKLRQRYEAARDMADQPDKLYQAKAALDSLHHALDEALLDPAKAVAGQKAVMEADEQTRLTKIEWERTLDVVQDRLLPSIEAKVARDDGDADQIAEVKRMIADAKQAAKGGDHAGGLHQLALVRTRMDQIARDPNGPVIGSRNQLPTDAALYRDAVTAMVREIEVFPALVKKRLGNVSDEVAKRLDAMLQDARNRFIPGAFDLSAQRLSSKLKDPERRAEREAALAQVRQLRTLLQEHPTIARLRANPVAPLEPAAEVVEQRLARLEANIRRCVH